MQLLGSSTSMKPFSYSLQQTKQAPEFNMHGKKKNHKALQMKVLLNRKKGLSGAQSHNQRPSMAPGQCVLGGSHPSSQPAPGVWATTTPQRAPSPILPDKPLLSFCLWWWATLMTPLPEDWPNVGIHSSFGWTYCSSAEAESGSSADLNGKYLLVNLHKCPVIQ